MRPNGDRRLCGWYQVVGMSRVSVTAPDVEPLVDEGRLSRLQFWRKVQLGLVLAGAVLLIALSRPLFASDHWARAVLAGIGILAIAAAVFGRLWSALYIGGRKKLEIVRDGPYAAVRNPLYVASLAGIFGTGLVFGSLLVAVFGTLVCFLIFDRIVHSEEIFLRQRFGDAFRDYCEETPRWRPNWSRVTFQGQVTVDVAVVMRTMREALIFFVVLGLQPLITMYDESGALPNLFVLP
jgi:protein-S-isoprenylcysteine O-methyltransferase Ste14